MIGKIMAQIAVSALLAQGCGTSAFAAERPPATATAMTAYELLLLYSGKTWLWRSGAGYMEPEGRVFRAWSSADDKDTFGEGKWELTDTGKLCFRAKWYAANGVADKLTCFSHLQDNGTIYQRRSPRGKWYVFKHADVLAGDEFNKVVPGDLATDGVARIREKLGKPAISANPVTYPSSEGVTQ